MSYKTELDRDTGKLRKVYPGEQMPAQNSAFKFVENLSDDELRLLAREKLSEALQAINPQEQPELTRKLVAEVKDRLDGKPGQQITVDQNLNVVTVNAQIQFVKAQPVIESNALVIENSGNQ